MALAAAEGAKVIKIDTKQAYLFGDMGDDVVTIFMKRKGAEYVIHGLLVDDMMHIYSCDAKKDEFLALYKKDFEITSGDKMETFLSMVVEQDDKRIKIHL